jgi:L-lactate dehydrogenase
MKNRLGLRQKTFFMQSRLRLLCGSSPAIILNLRVQNQGVRKAAYHIIEGKGSTYYGIGAGIARITRAIRLDERAVLTVSALTAEIEGIQDVALSVPRVVGAEGVLAALPPTLCDQEHKALQSSAEILKKAAEKIGY